MNLKIGDNVTLKRDSTYSIAGSVWSINESTGTILIKVTPEQTKAAEVGATNNKYFGYSDNAAQEDDSNSGSAFNSWFAEVLAKSPRHNKHE